MPYIYKITNKINGKDYIGKTLLTPEKRFKEHCADCKREHMEKRPLYSAMNKYGIENFVLETLEECSVDEINEREKYWIEKLGTFKNGYNATIGGDGRAYVDYELIKKLYYDGNGIKGISRLTGHDITTIRKILENYGISKEERAQHGVQVESKPVIMIDKNTNEELKVFPSIKEAERFLGINYTTHIAEVCKGKRKTCQGYKWKYLDNN